MPRIILKHKSPEFADSKTQNHTDKCEMPGCPEHAQHKAPKHRALNEYYAFCLRHAQDYNKAWDFFSGMNETEVQEHMLKSHYGDRPTWKYSNTDTPEDLLREEVHKTYQESEEEPINQQKENFKRSNADIERGPEHEAMAIMGLAPPVTLDEIKTRYKTLAKKHHPDLNKNSPDAEELLKKINMAYTILKLAFQDYKNLPDHKQ